MNVIRMASPALATNNLLSFTVTGPAGLSCTVQGSTDLVAGAWTNLGSITLSGGSAQFTDVNSASFSQRFYRVSSGSKLSDNVAGFLVRSGPSGQLLVANPFNCADNRAPALFPNLVDGSILWKFDVASQYYRNANTYYAGYGWGDPEMTLNPGEGVIVQSTSAYTMRWVGFVPQNCLSASIPALGSINSSLTAVGGQVDTALGFPVANGDWIARMTDTQGNWTTYTNQNATWSPSAPTVSLGEAFYSYKGSAFVWRQNLSVW